MTRFLLDTGSAGDYIHRRRGVYERARDAVRAGDRIGICLPVLAELWHGIENSNSRERNAQRLRRVKVRDCRGLQTRIGCGRHPLSPTLGTGIGCSGVLRHSCGNAT
jgi:hypothetical protein